MNVMESVIPLTELRTLTIREFLESCDLRAIPFVWTAWWCKVDSLPARAKVLVQRLRSISKPNIRFDVDQTHVRFSNVVPVAGQMYDLFTIYAMDDKPLFTIVPRAMSSDHFERSLVISHQQAHDVIVVDGTWADVKRYFRSKS